MSFLIVEWAMGFLKYALFGVLINVFYTSDFNASRGGKCTLSLFHRIKMFKYVSEGCNEKRGRKRTKFF